MKRIFTAVLCGLLCLLTLIGCAKAPRMTVEGDVYTVDGRRYVPAPTAYEAKALVDGKPVARLDRGELGDLLFYEISGISPERMIASADYELFCAEGSDLPALWELNPTRAHIFQSSGSGGADYSLVALEDGADLDAIVEAWKNGAAFAEADIEKGNTYGKYDLRFESDTYAGLYYKLTYREYKEDVLVYQIVDDLSDFEILYPGVEVTTEEYPYTDKNGQAQVEYYAVYHFGKYILYDRESGMCRAIGDAIAKRLTDA